MDHGWFKFLIRETAKSHRMLFAYFYVVGGSVAYTVAKLSNDGKAHKNDLFSSKNDVE